MASLKITAVPASQPGALPSFVWTCPICGDHQGSSMETSARVEAEAHVAWHAKRGEVAA